MQKDFKNQLSFAKEIKPIIVFKIDNQISGYHLTSLPAVNVISS